MTDRSDLQKAIRESMQTEKDAMDYYHHAGERLTDPRAKDIFKLLAREERQHAFSFFVLYHGEGIPSFESFIETPPNTASEWWKSLEIFLSSGCDERLALETALKLEEFLEKRLRQTAESIDVPEVRAIYLANANSTHKHHELIAERYQALFQAPPS